LRVVAQIGRTVAACSANTAGPPPFGGLSEHVFEPCIAIGTTGAQWRSIKLDPVSGAMAIYGDVTCGFSIFVKSPFRTSHLSLLTSFYELLDQP